MKKWAWGSLSFVLMLTFVLVVVVKTEPATGKTSRLEAVIPDFTPMWRSEAITRIFLTDLMPMFTDHVPVEPLTGQGPYCERYPGDCQSNESDEVVMLDDHTLGLIVGINQSVNLEVAGADDIDLHWMSEWWTYPDKYGDCEDYVLEKRRRFKAMGVSASALLITYVIVDLEVINPDQKFEDDDRYIDHAVLTVRTDKGDLILDNLVSEVLPWQYSPHYFISRQTPLHARKWEKIDDIREDEMFAAIDLSHG